MVSVKIYIFVFFNLIRTIFSKGFVCHREYKLQNIVISRKTLSTQLYQTCDILTIHFVTLKKAKFVWKPQVVFLEHLPRIPTPPPFIYLLCILSVTFSKQTRNRLRLIMLLTVSFNTKFCHALQIFLFYFSRRYVSILALK